MDKQHVVDLLSKQSKIVIETMTGERIPVEKIDDNTDDDRIHVLEPEEKEIVTDQIKDIEENDFDQL